MSNIENLNTEEWQCLLCTCKNTSTHRYCYACKSWKWEHIFNDSPSNPPICIPSTNTLISSDTLTSTPSNTITNIPINTSSPPISNPPPHIPESSESAATPQEDDNIQEKCPKPDSGVSILEFPWDLELLYDRGRTLLMKISVRRNSKKAWDLLSVAAERGHPAAQWDLELRKPNSDEIDWDKAVEFYVMKMQTCNPIPNLSPQSSDGSTAGSTSNSSTSKEDTNQSNHKHQINIDYGAVAAFCLGCCFLGGWGVERREDRAVALYKIAVQRGYLKGLNEVGWIYDHGLGGVKQDSVSAFQCFKVLAQRGYALAQYNTGRCYRDSRGVSPNIEKAVKWLVKAASQGYHNAQRSLGNIYQFGADNIIEKDMVRAMELYRDSASNGDPAGFHKIQELIKNTRVTYRGSGVVKEPVSYFVERKMKKNNFEIVIIKKNDHDQENVIEKEDCGTAKDQKVKEIVGDFWIPKLFDKCCFVLSKEKRDVYINANIPLPLKTKVEKGQIQCSAGCGMLFYGKGRVTRTFVFMKLVEEGKKKDGDIVGSWKDFATNTEIEAVWRDTKKYVTMHFCSTGCSEGFLQRVYWDF